MAAAHAYGRKANTLRPSGGAILFWAALSLLPDADLIGLGLGLGYRDAWGHRGASHSLLFALAIGIAVGLLALLGRRPAFRAGGLAVLVVASHSFLDTFTNSTTGVRLLWPFDDTRYLAPYTPIPVTPLGLGFISPYGLYVFITELTLFAPLVWFALRRGQGRALHAPVAVLWPVAIWVLLSADPVRNRIVLAILRDNTQFTNGFSEEKLDSVRRGASTTEVRSILGPPFGETPGFQGTCWIYSRSPDNRYFRALAVCFADDRVTNVVHRWIRG
jgi:inner membrane protein